MKTAILVQARMGSTRLPGKVVESVGDKLLIQRVLERLKPLSLPIILLLSMHDSDFTPLVEAAWPMLIPVFMSGRKIDDLVGRHVDAIERYDIDIVIRVPGDNPCVDYAEINRLITVYDEDPRGWNYLHTNLDRHVLGNGYPGGLGAEIYDARFFKWMDKNLTEQRHREHPHTWAGENRKVRTIEAPREIRRPWMDFSVNTPEDLERVRHIYRDLDSNFTSRELIEYMDRRKNGK